MRKNYLILSACLCLLSSIAFSQDSTQNSTFHFKFGLNYHSALNYYGRTDSLQSSGFFPLAELWLGKDFYINAAPVFVNNRVQSFDYAGTVATAGYQHITKHSLTSFYVLKPFYKESSQLVQSALKAQTGLSISWLNKILNLTAGGDIKFSGRTDFGASAGVDHLIRLPLSQGQALVIDPSFYTYAGTQNFTNTYYKKQPGLPLFGNSEQAVSEDVQKFNILSYEFSMPVIYVRGKWMALITPAYVLPQNLITVPGRPDLSERGKDLFYATAGVKYSF